ncbi:MAG: ABC transporter ATP-binding protein [Saprospiraceae bacterium]
MDIVVDQITKTYDKGRVTALHNISFEVPKGSLFGLIGPDGSGKTSLFRVLTTLLLAEKGKASVLGWDVVKDFQHIRNNIGYMPGKFSLYQDLSIEENLRFFATVFNTSIQANYDLIKDIYVQLEPFKNRPSGKLSGGMKQKLALCCALIHRPKVLFLDEPTTGVDAVSRKEFWHMLEKLKKTGLTILVSTPYMDEASLCETIALIQEGEIMSIDTPNGIINAFPEDLYAVKTSDMHRLLKDLRAMPDIQSCFSFGEYHHVTFKSSNKGTNVANAAHLSLLSKSHLDIDIKKITPTVEDCFIQLMVSS